MNLVWKKSQVFSKAAELFLQALKDSLFSLSERRESTANEKR